jgi:hypothetical protein
MCCRCIGGKTRAPRPVGWRTRLAQGDIAVASDLDFLKTTDFAAFQDMRSAAKFIVFHHPELLTIDPGVAGKILGYIESTPGFNALVASLNDQGVAQGPESDYEGWANGQYLLDAQGAKIGDGKGGYYWAYQYTSDTRRYMTAVVQQALLKVRDDVALEGVRFQTLAAGVPDTNAPGAYAFDDTDWHSGCQITLDSADAHQVALRVTNGQDRHLGIFARFLDALGAPIPLATLPAFYLAAGKTVEQIGRRRTGCWRRLGLTRWSLRHGLRRARPSKPLPAQPH